MGTEKGICSGGGRRNPHESMRDRRKASVNGAKQGSKASQRVEVARSSRIFEAMFYLQPNTTNGKTHRNFKQEGGGILFFKRLRKAWIEETPYTPVYACGSYGNAGERKWQGGLMELQENRGVEKYLEEKLIEFGNGSIMPSHLQVLTGANLKGVVLDAWALVIGIHKTEYHSSSLVCFCVLREE